MKSDEIIVSISCLAFNHGPYIRQCLDGFMMQKTNFAFEVLIHDDASTDHTSEIIKEYEKRYPDVIKPIYQKVNQYSKGIKPTFKYNFPRAQGKYTALCEGDDYWTDPLKLQRQVDFLEANPEYAICSHNVQIVGSEFGQAINRPYHKDKSTGLITIPQLIAGFRLPTNAIMFRTCLKSNLFNEPWMTKVRSGDKCLYLTLANYGKVFYDNTIMAAYRKHPGGVVGSYDSWTYEQHLKVHQNQIFFWKNFKKYFSPYYQNEIDKNIAEEYAQLTLKTYNDGQSLRQVLLPMLRTKYYKRSVYNNLKEKLIPLLKMKKPKLYQSKIPLIFIFFIGQVG